MLNLVLEAIRKRRSVLRFESTQIKDEKLQAVLEAGRWAPSWMNTQSWRFIVVRDEAVKDEVAGAAGTVFSKSIRDAPLCIAVCVDPEQDPYHFVEAGSGATQNMALAAQSLELGTSWIGVFSFENERHSSERKLKQILKIPKKWRLIAILPLGVPKDFVDKGRKQLSELINEEYFTEMS